MAFLARRDLAQRTSWGRRVRHLVHIAGARSARAIGAARGSLVEYVCSGCGNDVFELGELCGVDYDDVAE